MKNNYIEKTKDFILWFEKALSGRKYKYFYVHKKPKNEYTFFSIYDAYIKYEWDNKTYEENKKDLDKYSDLLIKSINTNDNEFCKETCLNILKWGGYRVYNGNKEKINEKYNNNQLCKYLLDFKQNIELNKKLDTYYKEDTIINSGFTKIYSLYIDNFIIYDTRVGAALCYFVKKYCEENNINKIPEELDFLCIREKRRNPSNSKYNFSTILSSCNHKKRLECNIKANWLLSELAKITKSEFANVNEKERLRTIEAGLFMIGYDIENIEVKI